MVTPPRSGPDTPAAHRQRAGPAPWFYLFGTLAWTWAFWWLATMTGQRWLEYPTVILSALGFLGPLAVSLLLVALGYWDGSLRAFLSSSFDPRRLPLRWYGVILGILLSLHLLPILLGAALLGFELTAVSFSAPTAFLLVGALAGAIEEPGWRGYAQDALQRRVSVLAATFITGLFWAAWHLPLFFLEGSYQHALGYGTVGFWGFNLAILVRSPIYAWLYNVAGRIAFAAVLYHTLFNVAAELFFVEGLETLKLVVEAVLALALTLSAWRWMSKPNA